jgi:hypothetical protein
LRGSTGWEQGQVSPAYGTTRVAGRTGGRREYRACHSRPSVEAVPLQDNGAVGQHRSPHRCGHGIRGQVLRVPRMVALAERLSGEASRVGEEAPGNDSLDIGPVLRKRDRAGDNGAGCGQALGSPIADSKTSGMRVASLQRARPRSSVHRRGYYVEETRIEVEY